MHSPAPCTIPSSSSEVGEGTFVFHTLSAADISRVIDHRVQELFQDTLECEGVRVCIRVCMCVCVCVWVCVFVPFS